MSTSFLSEDIVAVSKLHKNDHSYCCTVGRQLSAESLLFTSRDEFSLDGDGDASHIAFAAGSSTSSTASYTKKSKHPFSSILLLSPKGGQRGESVCQFSQPIFSTLSSHEA